MKGGEFGASSLVSGRPCCPFHSAALSRVRPRFLRSHLFPSSSHPREDKTGPRLPRNSRGKKKRKQRGKKKAHAPWLPAHFHGSRGSQGSTALPRLPCTRAPSERVRSARPAARRCSQPRRTRAQSPAGRARSPALRGGVESLPAGQEGSCLLPGGTFHLKRFHEGCSRLRLREEL